MYSILFKIFKKLVLSFPFIKIKHRGSEMKYFA